MLAGVLFVTRVVQRVCLSSGRREMGLLVLCWLGGCRFRAARWSVLIAWQAWRAVPSALEH